jgi:tRNA threonylcarbamoyl adenosine modification protein (Sua5/YciO/YrdC/YwlC family)
MSLEAALEALRRGRLAVVPTDTVYGLAAGADSAAAVARLYRVKERGPEQPTALVVSDVDRLRACIPELDERALRLVDALLPGPYTLVVPNPARRYAWLAGSTPEAIGIRIPAVTGVALELLERAGSYAAASANARGGRDPRTLADVPAEVRAAADAEVDAGELGGKPSTVLDLTGAEPRILREAAVPAEEALRLLARVL